MLPASAELLASSPDCPVQMFRVGANVYATQFHPELDVDGITTRIHAYADHGYFAADELELTLAAVRRAAGVASEPDPADVRGAATRGRRSLVAQRWTMRATDASPTGGCARRWFVERQPEVDEHDRAGERGSLARGPAPP